MSNLEAFVANQNAEWHAFVANSTAAVAAAIDDAEATISQAAADKREAIAARDKEIRWAITSVYEYDWQHKLTKALDEARAEADAACDEREASLAERIAAARA